MASALHRALTREISLGGALSGALGWWTGELRALAGGPLSRRLLGTEPLVVESTGEGWRARRGREAADLDALTKADRRAPAVLELATSDVLRKTLRLPEAAAGDLDKLLAFEIGRMTPFGAEHAYFTHEIRRRTEEGFLDVRLTVVPRETVDAALAALAVRGLAVGEVRVAGSARNLVPSLAPPPVLWTGANRLLLALLLLAAAGAATAPLVAAHLRASRAEQALAELRPRAEAAARAREASGAVAARRAEMARALANTPSAVAVLDALTRAVPDGSYLTSLSLAGREVLIDGLSPAAAALPRALEAVAGVQRVAYRAPVVRDPATGLERFQFSLLLAKRSP